jgi:hypothetical protein
MAESGVHDRRDFRRMMLPMGSIAAAAVVIVPAVAFWSGDRSELHATSKTTAEHSVAIDKLKLDAAARDARDIDLRRQLDRLQDSLDRIADRFGVAKHQGTTP